jgi:hypothetical protein
LRMKGERRRIEVGMVVGIEVTVMGARRHSMAWS